MAPTRIHRMLGKKGLGFKNGRSVNPTVPRPRYQTLLSGQFKHYLKEYPYLQFSPEVKDAWHTDKPVVALETTIYTHGFPYPDNVALALDLESIVRSNGGVPATIGILDGIAKIGMSTEELRLITAAARDPETMKVSRRDLPYILGLGQIGRKYTGGTTVAGTMILANKARISVFGTGGIGGVHRGGQETMDISADLTELGRTPVAVISSGCKSFLDIPKTLEYLETQGAGVFTFADQRTGEIDFPSFYTRDSGIKSPSVVQNEKEAAAIIHANFTRNSGQLFANPIPEEYSIPKEQIDFAINQAIEDAAEQGIHGSANTPFILARIKELTKGNSLEANRALIESNVAVATKVAVELSRLRVGEHDSGASESSREIPSSVRYVPQVSWKSPNRDFTLETASEVNRKRSPRDSGIGKAGQEPANEAQNPDEATKITVFGSVAMDLSCNYVPSVREMALTLETESQEPSDRLSPQLHTSNAASIGHSIGGVGHNVALAAQRAGWRAEVRLRSFVADDFAGNTILKAMEDEVMDISGIQTLPGENDLRAERQPLDTQINRTAQYVAINDTKRDLVLAMADMSIYSGPLPSFTTISSSRKHRKLWVVVDANWSPSKIREIMKMSEESTVVFEPVSVAKSAQLFQPDLQDQAESSASREYKISIDVFPENIVDIATPNQYELTSMHASAKKHDFFESERWWQIIDACGIPNSGARDKFIALTNHKLTDEGIPLQAVQLLPFIPTIITKLGSGGVLYTTLLKPDDARLTDPATAPYILSRTSNGSTEIGGVYMRLFPANERVDDVVSVNGVGDTFVGVLVAALAKGIDMEGAIALAQRGAVMTLRSPAAVSPQLGFLSGVLNKMANRAASNAMDKDLMVAAGFQGLHK